MRKYQECEGRIEMCDNGATIIYSGNRGQQKRLFIPKTSMHQCHSPEQTAGQKKESVHTSNGFKFGDKIFYRWINLSDINFDPDSKERTPARYVCETTLGHFVYDEKYNACFEVGKDDVFPRK